MSRNLSQTSRYAAILVALCLITLVEARHPFPLFRLVTFILAFLAFADLASLLRGKSRDGLVVLASLVFGLCVVEGVATVLEPKTLINVTNGWSVARPVIGWGPEHPGRFHAESRDPKSGDVIYVADYTIDASANHFQREGPGDRLFRRFLYLRRGRERCRNIASAFRGSARPQAAGSQSQYRRLWTAAVLA
jgi:hypothetical protein